MDNCKSLVSVIIPTLNRSQMLSCALESVLTQSYPNYEVIVVDDGSSDGTRELVGRYCNNNSRVRLIEHGERRGAQAARNTGIRESRGEWIAFLDSDDQWLPHSLEARLKVANRERVKVVHSECYVIREEGKKKPFGIPPMAGWIYHDLLTRQGPVFPALLVARQALETIGYLDEQIVSYQEWDAAIRLAKHYPFGFAAQPTFIYDCRGADTISKDLLRDAMGYEQVFRKHILAILRHAGARATARHFEGAAVRYQAAGQLFSARRCKLMALLCWPTRPGIMKRIHRILPI